MSDIKKLKDSNGNTIYPITHIDAVFNSEGKNVFESLDKYQEKEDENLITEDKTIIGSINEIQLNLDKTENTKYSTVNGVKEFSCKNGYIDNVVIEGKTLVNLVPLKNEASSPIGTASDGSSYVRWHTNDTNPRITNGTFTLFNLSNKRIQFLIRDNSSISTIIRQVNIDPGSKVEVLSDSEHIRNFFGYDTRGWDISEAGAIELCNSVVILEGDHSDKSISHFEGLKSVGQGDKIEVLTYQNSSNIIDNVHFTESALVDWASGEVISWTAYYKCSDYIEIEPNTEYTFINGNFNIAFYDSNKSFISVPLPDSIYSDFYFLHVSPANAKYLRVTVPNDRNVFIGKLKSDKKQLSVTLRSLPNGVKDTIEKRGNKYVKVQRCEEVILDGNVNVTEVYKPNYSSSLNYLRFLVEIHEAPNWNEVFCDKLSSIRNYEIEKDNIFSDKTYSGFFVTLHNDKTGGTIEGFKTYLEDNPITVVYELATPIITELPNFNPQTYKGDTTLLINSGVIQAEAEFEVTNSKGSEIEALKDKVSSLDNYESGYEYSNELIYLNGTQKPDWAESPYVVRIGKICILHCVVANDSASNGLPMIKLPSFAIPKQLHRCNGRGKINNSGLLALVDYDITTEGLIILYGSGFDITAMEQLYIHYVWEVE